MDSPDDSVRELAKKTARSLVDHGQSLAPLKEIIKLHDKVDALLSKEIEFPEPQEIPEVDLTPIEEKLDELLVEAKKKDSLEYDLSIDEATRAKLKGDKGDSYVLTSKDKKEIAQSIEVPVVERIVEQPIITNEIREVAIADTPQETATKLNTLEEVVEIKVIKGLEKALQYIRENRVISGGVKALANLFDVNISSPTNGQALVYNSTTQKWENGDVSGGSGGAVDSVNGQTGVVLLDTSDIAATTDNNYVTDADLTTLSNTSGTNTGDQNNIGGIAVSGQDTVIPDSPADTFTFIAGTNVTITTDNTTKVVTFDATSGGVNEDSFGLVVDGGGNALTTGSKGFKYIPWDCTITGWSILSDVSGSVVVNVKRSGVSLAGTEKPTLSSASSNSDLALSTWTTSLTAGDVVEFVVDSASTLTRITLTILVTKV